LCTPRAGWNRDAVLWYRIDADAPARRRVIRMNTGEPTRSPAPLPEVSSARRPLVVTPAGVIATLVLLLVCLLCVRLGFWQLDRRAQRLAYNDAIASRHQAMPVASAEQLRDTTDLIFRTASLSGRYDHDRALVLPGRSHAGAPGVHLLTPLLLDGSSHGILVNRGWVPAADGVSIDFDYFARDTAGTLPGILLPFPRGAEPRVAAGSSATAGSGGAVAAPFRRVWYGIDERALRAQFPYPLLDAQLQLIDDGTRTTAPLPLAAPQLDEGPHLGYAIQWFSFALIGFVGWGVLVLKGGGPGSRQSGVAPTE
jgi:surfeit locus 1 family protein